MKESLRLPLVDELLKFQGSTTCINGKWYVAKPLPHYYSLRNTLLRIKSAWYVLTGRALAVQFAQDQIKHKEQEHE